MKFIKRDHRKFYISLLTILILTLSQAVAESLTLDLGNAEGSFSARLIQLFLAITVLSVAPSLVIMVTSFTRMVVVLSFLRTSLGLQQSPPNMVMVSLAMFLTLFVMAPTFEKAYNDGIAPLIAEKISEEQALYKAAEPFKEFMLKNVREKDLGLFLDLSRTGTLEKPSDTPLKVLVPAFMISELKRSFEIGFLIFIPFLIIDLVVAAILMSMGMMMLPPVMISLPFKIIFFVLIDGWHLLSGSLVNSFS
ncbi:flagellar type III secretion system pore protein FliP [Candidatus Odyssella thessalonicensis]|uniref:flagellar type III secretion system pore protein FliP n=1 Tax=Candidatus Odyssella thessalonicensis TaxID=84647 RepID=UPI000225A944|nr:flagellar type III secretion system pore protein FliP [Candidatus Odyssella thessalonicensis]